MASLFRRPDGRAIPPRPVTGPGDHRGPARHNKKAGLGIDCNTSVPHWDGSRLRLADAVERIVRLDSRFPAD